LPRPSGGKGAAVWEIIDSMKKRIIIAVVGLLIPLSAACTAVPVAQPIETGVPAATETRPTKTATPRPTVTLTPTPSEIPTVEPMVTPSPGPAPDVEIFNVSFSSTVTNITTFFGEIRNNMDRPAIFPGRLVALRLGIEQWTMYGGVYYNYYKFDAYIIPHPDTKRMNCILYPGEIGIIAFDYNICSSKDNCLGEGEQLEAPPQQMGNRLINYEVYPKRWEDFLEFKYIQADYPSVFDPNFHLKIENVSSESQIIDEQADWGVMFFDFDLTYYWPPYQQLAKVPVWIIMYNKEGRIINVGLNNWIHLCEGHACAKSGQIYHISGAACNQEQCLWADWAETKPALQWFKPIARLTIDEMKRVDHIRILAENQDDGICIDTDFDRR
jgi:hypothetical protein